MEFEKTAYKVTGTLPNLIESERYPRNDVAAAQLMPCGKHVGCT